LQGIFVGKDGTDINAVHISGNDNHDDDNEGTKV
jgi:hypothetical protein